MARTFFDLKKFSYKCAEGGLVTLQHKDGHEVKMAIKALKPEFREILEAMAKESEKSKKMADGGKVKAPPRMDPTPDRPTQEKPVDGAHGRSLEDVKNTLMNPSRWWDGDKKPGYAEGGEVEQPAGTLTPEQKQAVSAFAMGQNSHPEVVVPQIGHGPTPYADSLAKALPQPNPAVAQQMVQEGNLQPETAAQVSNQAMAAQPEMPQAPQAPGMDATAPQASTMPTPTELMQQGLGMQAAALQEQYKAATAQGARQAAADAAYQGQLKQMQLDFTSKVDENAKNIAATIQDIKNNHINPRAYQENMGTGQKVATAIGLIAGGFSQAYTGKNPALDMLNAQIDRDIKAQQSNMDNRQTLLSAYQKQFSNIHSATDMTRATLSGLYASQLSEAAHKAATPQAKAVMLAGSGELQIKAAQLAQQATLNEYLSKATSGADQNPEQLIAVMQQIDPARAKDLRERLVPGVGFANSPDDRKAIIEVEARRQAIRRGVREAGELIRKAGTYEMLGSHNADVDRLADQIATDMAKMQDPATAARPGEVEMVKQTLFGPGIFSRKKTELDKMSHFLRGAEKRANDQYTLRGLKPPSPMSHMSAQERQFADWAMKNPNDPKAKLVLQKLGIGQ